MRLVRLGAAALVLAVSGSSLGLLPAWAATGLTGTLVAVPGGGGAFSPDGLRLLREYYSTGHIKVYNIAARASRTVDTTAAGTPGNGRAYSGIWAPDSSRVAFASEATNLTNPDGLGAQVFVKDLASGSVRLLSSGATGTPANNLSVPVAWSPDGSLLLFYSYATNLVDGMSSAGVRLYLKNVSNGSIRVVSATSGDDSWRDQVSWGSFSPDGLKIAFATKRLSTPASATGIYVLTVGTGAVRRVDDAGSTFRVPSGVEPSPVWSPSGKLLAYGERRAGSDGVFRDQLMYYSFGTGAVRCVSCTSGGTFGKGAVMTGALWAPIGNRIAFESKASNFDSGDKDGTLGDVFVKDLITGSIRNVSTSSSGRSDTTHVSYLGAWKPSGDAITFWSWDSSLVVGDSNATHDVFIKYLATNVTRLVSASSSGAQSNGSSVVDAWRPGTSQLMFDSSGTNLVPGLSDGEYRTYLKSIP